MQKRAFVGVLVGVGGLIVGGGLVARARSRQPPDRQKRYRPSRAQRVANQLMTRLVRRDRGPKFISLLTVRGRVTGEARTTPVVPIEHGDQRWIVAPFGEVGWVRDARASGHVELGRGADVHAYRVDELRPAEATPVLREYLAMPTARYVHNYFEVTTESSDEEIAAVAPRHPVFALRE